VQKEFSEEVLKTVKESKGSLDKVPSNEVRPRKVRGSVGVGGTDTG
jgi:hypothetical protein